MIEFIIKKDGEEIGSFVAPQTIEKALLNGDKVISSMMMDELGIHTFTMNSETAKVRGIE